MVADEGKRAETLVFWGCTSFEEMRAKHSSQLWHGQAFEHGKLAIFVIRDNFLS